MMDKPLMDKSPPGRTAMGETASIRKALDSINIEIAGHAPEQTVRVHVGHLRALIGEIERLRRFEASMKTRNKLTRAVRELTARLDRAERSRVLIGFRVQGFVHESYWAYSCGPGCAGSSRDKSASFLFKTREEADRDAVFWRDKQDVPKTRVLAVYRPAPQPHAARVEGSEE